MKVCFIWEMFLSAPGGGFPMEHVLYHSAMRTKYFPQVTIRRDQAWAIAGADPWLYFFSMWWVQ